MKSNKNSFDIVRRSLIVALQLDEVEAESIDATTTSASLEKWNSLTHVTLFLELEDSLGIRFDVDEIVELASVKAIVRAVEGREG